jgi:hypothetical protein
MKLIAIGFILLIGLLCLFSGCASKMPIKEPEKVTTSSTTNITVKSTPIKAITPKVTVTPSGLNYQVYGIGKDVRLHSNKLGNVDLLIVAHSAEITNNDVAVINFSVYNVGTTDFNGWDNLRYWFEGDSLISYFDYNLRTLPKLVGTTASGFSMEISTYVPQSKANGTAFHISLNNETEAAWRIY